MKQKHPDYLELLKKSLDNLRDHPVLLLPVIFGFFLFIIIAGFVILEGLFMITAFSVSVESLFPSIVSSGTMMLAAVLFIFADLLLAFFIGSYVSAMFYIGLFQASVSNKVSLDSMTRGAKRIFLNVLKYWLIRFALFFVPLAVVAGLVMGLVFVNWILALVLGVILFMVLVAFFIYVSFGMFFMAPMIAYKRRPIMNILRSSFRYLHKNIPHVLLTWVILLCISIALAFVILPLQIMASFIPLILVPFILFRIILQVAVAIYSNIFLFNSYFAVNKVKK